MAALTGAGMRMTRRRGSAFREGFGKVLLSRKGVVDTVFHGNGPAKQASFPAIKSVIENGMEIGSDPDHKGRGFDTVTFAAPIDFYGQKAPLGVVVKVYEKGLGDRTFYIHEICDAEGNYIRIGEGSAKKEISNTHLPDSSSGADIADSEVSLKNSIRNPDGNVKREYSTDGDDIRFSVEDGELTREGYDRLMAEVAGDQSSSI